MPRPPSKFLAVLLSCSLLGGCLVGPDYQRPPESPPPAYKEEVVWKRATPNDQIDPGAWWSIFGDSTLDRLMPQIAVNNQNVAAAEANWRQSLALLRVANSNLYPTVSTNASSLSGSPAAGIGQGAGGTRTQTSVQFVAQWEIDIWGQIRRNIESSQANADANLALLAAARLSAQSQFARAYYGLRAAEALEMVLTNTVVIYRRSLDLVTNQYAAGTASPADVAQAETQLKSAEAQLVDAHLSRQQFEHAMAVLLGLAPANFTLDSGSWDIAPPDIPVTVPSTLLERRPDVAAAERQMISANAQIGVAEAAWYPTISLAGAVSAVGTSQNAFLSLPSQVWSIGPSLSWLLFDFGGRAGQIDAAKAQYDQTVANYRGTILTAFQQVEDAIAGLNYLAQATSSQTAAVAAARRSETLVLNQYRAGTVSYLNVLVVQNQALQAERTALDFKRRQFLSAVDLITALGGGWQGLPAPSP